MTYRLTEKRAVKPPTYLLVSVCQPDFTDCPNDEASNDGSVALTLPDFPLLLPGLRLPG